MNKRTVALTTQQYKEILSTMKKGFSGSRPNQEVATALMLEANLGLRISDILDVYKRQALSYEDTLRLRDEVAPLLQPDADEASAVRFDALMYGIELAYLVGKKYARARSDLFKKVSGVAGVANIPEIQAQSELMEKILHTNYLDNAGINEFEHIRECLRGLMKYLPPKGEPYDTNFTDDILSVEWKESELSLIHIWTSLPVLAL